MSLSIVVLGLSITSSWGNGHATTYRGLVKALAGRGHRVTFLERDVPWYEENRDLPDPPYCRTELYRSLDELPVRFGRLVRDADLVIIGSYVPDGVATAGWVTRNAGGVIAFYDIDTPVTLARLRRGDCDYLSTTLIPRFDLYLSFTGGPVLDHIERDYGSPRARALYCSVDPDIHAPVAAEPTWALGYLGTYSADRQAAVDRLLVGAARTLPGERFAVAGPQYPQTTYWPANVDRFEHLAPAEHAAYYCAQRFTLNVTRADMIDAGFSPSVRLFEAAACGVPIISDGWAGIGDFLTPGREILVAERTADVVAIIAGMTAERRHELAAAARRRVLASHTADCRARELEAYYDEVVRAGAKGRAEAVA